VHLGAHKHRKTWCVVRQSVNLSSNTGRVGFLFWRHGVVVLASIVALLTSTGSAQAWESWPSEWSPGRPSLAADVTSAPDFRLIVPFRTQKDGGPWQTSNCGPASLGMVLDGFGLVGQGTDDLRFRAHTYQGTVGMRTGTALEHIAHVAEDLGLTTYGLYDVGGRFRSWSTEEIRIQVRLGRPVMPLVRSTCCLATKEVAPVGATTSC